MSSTSIPPATAFWPAALGFLRLGVALALALPGGSALAGKLVVY